VAVVIVAIFFVREGAVAANDVLGGLAIALIGLALAQGRLRFDLKEAWPYLAYLGALTASAVLAASTQTWLEYRRQLIFLGLVFAVCRHARTERGQRALVAVLVACTIAVLLNALAFSLQLNVDERPLGYAAVGQWSGYPELGLLASMGAAGAIAAFAAGRSWAFRSASAVLAAGFSVAALLLYSRSAWLTIAIVALWLGIASLVRWRRVAMAVLLAALLVSTLLTAWSSPLVSRYLASLTNAADSTEVTSRLHGWAAAAAMTRDHPVFGVGPGNYSVFYPRYSPYNDPAHAYNLVLHVAAEIGLVGIVCYLAMWGRVVYLSYRLGGSTGIGVTAFMLHAFLLAFFVRSLSEHFLANLGTAFRFLLLLGVVFGLVEAVARRRRTGTSD
jgi:O-antigen ligase